MTICKLLNEGGKALEEMKVAGTFKRESAESGSWMCVWMESGCCVVAEIEKRKQ